MNPRRSPPTTTPSEPTEADVRWVQRVAAALAGHGEGGEDLAQDAWLELLSGRARAEDTDRGYLFGVIRNLAHRRRRTSRRRMAREREHEEGRGEIPSPETLLLRAEAQKRIADAALRLEEPLRSTLLLRFFEGVNVERIAEQHGVRADTVRARLRRAIRLLQADLDEGPGWRAVFALAVPLSPTPSGSPMAAEPALSSAFISPLVSVGPITMGLKTQALVAATTLLTVTGWVVLSGWPEALADRDDVAARAVERPGSAPSESPPMAGERHAEESSRTPLAALRSAESTALHRRPGAASGLGPIEGTITVVLPDGTTSSDASGSFTLRMGAAPDRSVPLRTRTVSFRAGAWTVPSVEDVDGTVTDFFVLGPPSPRLARDKTIWSGPLRQDSPHHWTVSVEALATIHVSGLDTSAPLTDVVVVTGRPTWDLPPVLTSGSTDLTTFASGASPLTVPTGAFEGDELELWVGGANHTWSPLTVPTQEDSETWVSLAEGGELELQFTSPLPPKCQLDLSRLDGPRGYAVDLGDDWYGELSAQDRMVLKGLVPGHYQVTVRFEPDRAELPLSRVVVEGRCRIRAGERTLAKFDGPPSAGECGAHDLSVELSVPPDWEVESYSLRLYPLRAGWEYEAREWTQASLQLDEQGRARAHASAVTHGTYLLEYSAPGVVSHMQRVEVDPETKELRLKIPAPLLLKLWVIDRQSGGDLALDSLMLEPVAPEGVSGRVTVLEVPNRGPNGAFRVLVPSGPQTVHVTVEDGRHAAQWIEASRDPTELVVQLASRVDGTNDE